MKMVLMRSLKLEHRNVTFDMEQCSKGTLKMTIFTCLSKSENITEYLYIHISYRIPIHANEHNKMY